MRFPGCLSLSTLATSASICNVQRITRRTSWVAVTGLAAEHDDANRTLPLPAAIMEYAVEAFMCRNRMPRCQSISEATGRGTCTYIRRVFKRTRKVGLQCQHRHFLGRAVISSAKPLDQSRVDRHPLASYGELWLRE